VTTKADLLLV